MALSAEAMKPSTFARVEGHLSSEGVFLMGDSQLMGFPIRYASPGFEQVYGFAASEIVGKRCGDLIGGPYILSHIESLSTVATAAGISLKDAEAGVRFLTQKAGEACNVMMVYSGSRVGVSLLLNRKKNGEVFVCECLVLNLRHPTVNWSYCVGFQRDITAEVSLRTLMAAATSEEAYARLIQSRSASLERRRQTLLGVGSENVVRYLHEKAMDIFSLDIWRTLRNELLQGGQSQPAPPATSSPAAPLSGAPHAQPASTACATPARRALHLDAASSPEGAPRTRPAACGPLVIPQQQAQVRSTGSFSIAPQASTTAARLSASGQQPARRADNPGDVFDSNAVVEFLSGLGLRKYAEPLIASGFDDMSTLVEVQEDDLKDLGIPRGHALKLQRSLRSYKALELCASLRQAGDRRAATSLADRCASRPQDAGAGDREAWRLAAPPPHYEREELPVAGGPPVAEKASADAGQVMERAPSDAKRNGVEESWERVQDFGVDRFGVLLFSEFFAMDPDASRLFTTEVCEKYWDWTAGGRRRRRRALRVEAVWQGGQPHRWRRCRSARRPSSRAKPRAARRAAHRLWPEAGAVHDPRPGAHRHLAALPRRCLHAGGRDGLDCRLRLRVGLHDGGPQGDASSAGARRLRLVRCRLADAGDRQHEGPAPEPPRAWAAFGRVQAPRGEGVRIPGAGLPLTRRPRLARSGADVPPSADPADVPGPLLGRCRRPMSLRYEFGCGPRAASAARAGRCPRTRCRCALGTSRRRRA